MGKTAPLSRRLDCAMHGATAGQIHLEGFAIVNFFGASASTQTSLCDLVGDAG
jgi:hypothetical protein